MINLILAILSSATISTLTGLSNKHVKNNMVMFTVNYVVCGLLSLLFLSIDGGKSISLGQVAPGDLRFAILLGIAGGALFLSSFLMLQLNIRKNGMVLAATFMRLGVLVPIVMSVVLRWDKPTALQIVGCVLAVAAIILINGEGDAEAGESSAEKGAGRSGMWLLLLLLLSGLADSLSNIFDKLGPVELKNHYLLFIFIAAFIFSFVLIFVLKQHFRWSDAAWGAVIGIPNYFSARFLLYALADVPAIVAYPVYNISVILIIGLLGYYIFKEKFSKRKLWGMAVIVAAILILNL